MFEVRAFDGTKMIACTKAPSLSMAKVTLGYLFRERKTSEELTGTVAEPGHKLKKYEWKSNTLKAVK